jgi:hypothetical protein
MYENSVWSEIALSSLNRMFMEDDTHAMKCRYGMSNFNNLVENKLDAVQDGFDIAHAVFWKENDNVARWTVRAYEQFLKWGLGE